MSDQRNLKKVKIIIKVSLYCCLYQAGWKQVSVGELRDLSNGYEDMLPWKFSKQLFFRTNKIHHDTIW